MRQNRHKLIEEPKPKARRGRKKKHGTSPIINFRAPDGLKDALERHAKRNERNLSKEIVARLKASFPGGFKTRS